MKHPPQSLRRLDPRVVRTPRVVVVTSGRGRVLDEALRQDDTFRAQLSSVVVDRECGAAQVATGRGVAVTAIRTPDNAEFSDALLEHCAREDADYLLLFFNRLLAGPILDQYENRIVNVHATLLPAFPGLRGFEDNLRSGARFTGMTLHFIDENVDSGRIILQAVQPIPPDPDPARVRHRQFVQMCKGVIQLAHWIGDGRVHVVGSKVVVEDAQYDDVEFSPTLDAAAAIALDVPYSTPP